MEKAKCPNCGGKLLVNKCLSEKAAIMKCNHCKKNFNVSFDEKTFPDKLNSFNWGAFLMNWLWCLFNGKAGLGWLLFLLGCLSSMQPTIGFLLFIPNIIVCFYLGIKGNKLAWNNKEWKSVEQFERVQTNWMIAGEILVAISLIITIFSLINM